MICERSIFYVAVLSVLGCGLSACKTQNNDSNDQLKDTVSPTTPWKPEQDGEWTAIVSLKDTTNTFKGTHEIPKPDTGWWVAPIHVNLLASGKILVSGWSRPKQSSCEDHQGRLNGTSFILDPSELETSSVKTLGITPIDEKPRQAGDVLYCSGHVPMADGRVLFMGGARYKYLGDTEFPDAFNQREYGLPYARVFNPSVGANQFSVVPQNNPGDPKPFDASNWTKEPNRPNTPAGKPPIPPREAAGGLSYESGMMWYPTNTRLPGGKILTNGGFARWIDLMDARKWKYLNKSVTTFDPALYDRGQNPWQLLVQHGNAPREVGIDTFDYPHVLVLPKAVMVDGLPRQVAIYGGIAYDPNDPAYQPGLTFLNIDSNVPETKRFASPPNSRRPNGGDSNAGKLSETTAALTSTGEIMIMGGGNNGEKEGQRIDLYNPSSGQWRSVDTGITRHKGGSTLLPDGTVLVVNGEEFYQTGKNKGDRRQITVFDPKTSSVKNLRPWADDNDMRGYHNVSMLLKDGRVLIGGGRIYQNGKDGIYRIGCERPELRIFSPPYLFKGPRPQIEKFDTEPKAVVAGGTAFKVSYTGAEPRADGGVVLMALGAYTHSFDQNQRIVKLAFVKTASGEINVTPPANTQVAPEGEYNLYLVSDLGVPSLAKTIRVGNR